MQAKARQQKRFSHVHAHVTSRGEMRGACASAAARATPYACPQEYYSHGRILSRRVFCQLASPHRVYTPSHILVFRAQARIASAARNERTRLLESARRHALYTLALRSCCHAARSREID